MWITVLLLILGFVILIKGADLLVGGASSIAKKKGISSLAIGLTVVAFGTSLPELIVSLFSALNGRVDAAFGNVLGSNIFNILLILGIAGIIYPLVVQRNTVKFEVPISLGALGILFLMVNDVLLWGDDKNILSRLDSGILLACFIGFLYYIYRTMSSSTEMDEGEPVKIHKTYTSIGMIVLGIAGLVLGGNFVVESAIEIAQHFGLSERFIGLTILAAGTSLPELATSAVAAYKKNTDIAIGNVVGSNIFNIFFILGITGTVSPIPYSAIMNTDMYILAGSTVLLMVFMFTLNTRKLDRWEAAIMLVLYVAYTLYLLDSDIGVASTKTLIR
jgi:cation:H+ antiporter